MKLSEARENTDFVIEEIRGDKLSRNAYPQWASERVFL